MSSLRDALRSAAPYLLRYRRQWAIGLLALVCKDLCGAALPLVIRYAVDALTQGFAIRIVLYFAGALLTLSLVKGLFQYWMRVVLVGLSRHVEFDLRNDLFARLAGLDAPFYARYRTGDLMARATNDLNAVRMMLGPGVMYLAETSLTFLLALAIMLSTDWRLTLLALLPAPLVSVVVVFFGRRIHARFEEIQGLFSDISSRVQENLSGVRVIRAYVQEESELRQFEALNRSFVEQNVRLGRLSALFYPLLQALVGLVFLLVLWVGGQRLLAHQITLGSFVMFNTYMGMLVWPMIAFGWVTNLVQRGTASWKRIRQVLTSEPTIVAPPAPRRLPERAGAIELDAVSLCFGDVRALDGISLSIPRGATVAIVGRTGSGKSSLVHLIPRLIDVTSGAVRLDSIDVRELDPEDLRRRIGFVPQETFLFSATLAGNIAFGRPDAPREAVERAAAIAGLTADIEGFPLGLDTVVGERGITLSGGQKQRTAIARAILRDPDILILDDALSSVDTITEERILQGLKTLFAARTSILISHRVSTVRHADTIYVLDGGCLMESGSHDELVRRGGYYEELHRKQLLEEELEAL